MTERRFAELMKGAAIQKRFACAKMTSDWEVFTKEIEYWQQVIVAYDAQSKANAPDKLEA